MSTETKTPMTIQQIRDEIHDHLPHAYQKAAFGMLDRIAALDAARRDAAFPGDPPGDGLEEKVFTSENKYVICNCGPESFQFACSDPEWLAKKLNNFARQHAADLQKDLQILSWVQRLIDEKTKPLDVEIERLRSISDLDGNARGRDKARIAELEQAVRSERKTVLTEFLKRFHDGDTEVYAIDLAEDMLDEATKGTK